MSTKKKIEKFNLEEFVGKSRTEKKNYILKECQKINVSKEIHSNLKDAFQKKEVINKFIEKLIKRKNNTEEKIKEDIKKQIELFKNNFLARSLPKNISSEKNTVFSMCGANILKSAQSISRSVSTSMGSLWEKIAACSNDVISPEDEFAIKITGIDAVGLINDKVTYIQLKTAEDTLTAGHSPRSVMELSIHENSFFATAFKTGAKWHFKSDNIEKFAGEDFWKKINLDYEFIFDQIKPMVLDIEKKYIELRDIKN